MDVDSQRYTHPASETQPWIAMDAHTLKFANASLVIATFTHTVWVNLEGSYHLNKRRLLLAQGPWFSPRSALGCRMMAQTNVGGSMCESRLLI